MRRAMQVTAARPRANQREVDVNDKIIAEAFERGSAWAGIIFTVSFGVMLVIAAWMGWS